MAKQTSEANQEIKGKIDDIQSSNNTTIVDIKEILEIIDEINTIVSTTASAVEEQSVVTSEISTNVP